MANVGFSTVVESLDPLLPIIVERSMWWPRSGWTEGHDSAGATASGTMWVLADGEEGGPRNVSTWVLIANTSTWPGEARVTLLYEDGTTESRQFALAASSRTTVSGAMFGRAAGRRFAVQVESLAAAGATPAQVVVERAMYSDANGRCVGGRLQRRRHEVAVREDGMETSRVGVRCLATPGRAGRGRVPGDRNQRGAGANVRIQHSHVRTGRSSTSASPASRSSRRRSGRSRDVLPGAPQARHARHRDGMDQAAERHRVRSLVAKQHRAGGSLRRPHDGVGGHATRQSSLAAPELEWPSGECAQPGWTHPEALVATRSFVVPANWDRGSISVYFHNAARETANIVWTEWSARVWEHEATWVGGPEDNPFAEYDDQELACSEVGMPKYSVHLGALSLTVRDTELVHGSVGPQVRPTRTFNSLPLVVQPVGVFGAGWQLAYESRITVQSNGVEVGRGSGAVLAFTQRGLLHRGWPARQRRQADASDVASGAAHVARSYS